MVLFAGLSRASVARAIKYGSPYVGLRHDKTHVCSWIRSTVRDLLGSSTRQTLPATSSVHSP